jgi:hypothetical protein
VVTLFGPLIHNGIKRIQTAKHIRDVAVLYLKSIHSKIQDVNTALKHSYVTGRVEEENRKTFDALETLFHSADVLPSPKRYKELLAFVIFFKTSIPINMSEFELASEYTARVDALIKLFGSPSRKAITPAVGPAGHGAE